MFNRTQNCLSRMSNTTVETFDIFGQSLSFRVLEKGKFTTPIGCFVTFLIGAATMLYMASELSYLYEKSKPNVFTAEYKIFDSTSFPLYNDNFTLAVTIADKNSNPIKGQLKYYNLTISHCVRQRIVNQTTGNVSVTLNCSQLPIAPCTRDDFTTDLQKEFFKNTRLGVVQCINRERLKANPPVLQGIISGYKYQYLLIEMTVCKNNTEYQGCAPQEEIQNILSAGHYSVYASDYLMQLDRGDAPYQEFINLDINSFSISTSKMLQWTYRIQEVHTDDGLFSTTDDISLNLMQQSKREQTELYNDDYLVYHYIQLDYKETVLKRSYIKVQVILSKIGGIWQLFIVVFTTLLTPILNNLMTMSIANELFRFPSKNNHIKLIDLQSSDSIVQVKQQKQQQTIDDFDDERLSVGLFQSILIIIGCNKKKKKIFDQVKEKILERVDVVKLLDKIQEIETLKYVLLDEEQNQLFDLIPKPLIKHDEQPQNSPNDFPADSDLKSSFRGLGKKKMLTKKLKNYYHSYSQISQFKSRNTIDEKLLNLIDKNVVKFFEEIQLSQHRSNNMSPLDPLFKSRIELSIYEPSIQKPR